MKYIAVLDREHLDNGIFLTAFAEAVSSHKERGLIVHSDSEYTERIIQTGVMREEAQQRAIKDLNHRLVALFADHGISAVGLNGYQKKMIVQSGNEIAIDEEQFSRLPSQPALLISTLIYSKDEDKPVAASIADVVQNLSQKLNIDDLFLFSRSEQDELIKQDLPDQIPAGTEGESFIKEKVPVEFQQNRLNAKLITAHEFGKYPNVENVTHL